MIQSWILVFNPSLILLLFSTASLLPNWEHPACCCWGSLWTGTGQRRCRGYWSWECNHSLNRFVALKKWRHCSLCCCCFVPNVRGQVTRLQEETVSGTDEFSIQRRCTLARGESQCININVLCVMYTVLVILCWFCGHRVNAQEILGMVYWSLVPTSLRPILMY